MRGREPYRWKRCELLIAFRVLLAVARFAEVPVVMPEVSWVGPVGQNRIDVLVVPFKRLRLERMSEALFKLACFLFAQKFSECAPSRQWG